MTGEVVSVRLSHLLRQCGVGAIVRGRNFLVAVQDTSKWYPQGTRPESRQIQYVDQVRRSLGISEILCTPPTATVETDGAVNGHWIPAVRFPTWMRCPQCGLLHRQPWRENPEAVRFRCREEECGSLLEQVPWVVVHADGYLADVPWHTVAHSARSRQQPERDARRASAAGPCWNGPPNLRIVLGDRRPFVRCENCGLAGELPERIGFPARNGQQPWIREPPPEEVTEPGWVVDVNDVRIHFPATQTALVIPPESRIRKGTVVDRLYASSEVQRRIKNARMGLQRRSILKRTADDWRCSVSDIEVALRELRSGYPLYGQPLAEGNLHWLEYSAFLDEIPGLREDEDFVTEHHTSAWNVLRRQTQGLLRKTASIVDRLIEVRRLQEILVFKGFSRTSTERIVAPDISGSSSWLPALSLRGEGIFFTISRRAIDRWGQQEALQTRSAVLSARLAGHPVQRSMQGLKITPQFVMLHTLAHAVIRRLESEAGYPAASLRERIYCGTDRAPMAGILIYVSVPDKIGSLGGLVQMAKPKRFLRILQAALDQTSWCSMDPVCASHQGQGPALLNLAACHACALIPDTSCEFGNTVLDRAFIKGDPTTGVAPLTEFTLPEA